MAEKDADYYEDDGYNRRRVTWGIVGAGAVLVGLVVANSIWGASPEESDPNYYIRNAPSPHDVHNSIPEEKVFPPGAPVQLDGGAATYQPDSAAMARTGLVEVLAFCGNPIDKRDPHNLYATITIQNADGRTSTMAGIAYAPACEDGAITAADLAGM